MSGYYNYAVLKLIQTNRIISFQVFGDVYNNMYYIGIYILSIFILSEIICESLLSTFVYYIMH